MPSVHSHCAFLAYLRGSSCAATQVPELPAELALPEFLTVSGWDRALAARVSAEPTPPFFQYMRTKLVRLPRSTLLDGAPIESSAASSLGCLHVDDLWMIKSEALAPVAMSSCSASLH